MAIKYNFFMAILLYNRLKQPKYIKIFIKIFIKINIKPIKFKRHTLIPLFFNGDT